MNVPVDEVLADFSASASWAVEMPFPVSAPVGSEASTGAGLLDVELLEVGVVRRERPAEAPAPRVLDFTWRVFFVQRLADANPISALLVAVGADCGARAAGVYKVCRWLTSDVELPAFADADFDAVTILRVRPLVE